MRHVLIVAPLERHGYYDSSVLDAASQGEQPAIIRRDQDYVDQARR